MTFMLFTGGDITITRKNENSRNLSLDIPFYITTNMLPQFQHAKSVMTRLASFDTTTLPSWLMRHGVAKYFLDTAMEHLHWMAMYIDENVHLVNSEELFYEQGTEKALTPLDIAREEKKQRLRTTRMYNLIPGLEESHPQDRIHQVSVTINVCFTICIKLIIKIFAHSYCCI